MSFKKWENKTKINLMDKIILQSSSAAICFWAIDIYIYQNN